jgi:hypothetical protein
VRLCGVTIDFKNRFHIPHDCVGGFGCVGQFKVNSLCIVWRIECPSRLDVPKIAPTMMSDPWPLVISAMVVARRYRRHWLMCRSFDGESVNCIA